MPKEITCPNCEANYSAKEPSCPECRERNPSRHTWSQKIIFGTLGVALLAWGIQWLTDPFARQGSQPSPPAASAPPSSTAPAAPADKPSAQNWAYSSGLDPMRNQTSYWAQCTSLEKVNMDFPFTEVQQQIILRNRPTDGFNIILALTQGQYSCGFDGCNINVRFDDGKIQKFRVSTSSDGDSKNLFVQNKKGFLSQLSKAHQVMIEADYFQRGNKTFTFHVDGLEWNH